MTTLSYTYISRCDGGGHFVVDIALDGGQPQRVTYTTDEIREPLSAIPQSQREIAALTVLKLHFMGQTRQQMVTAFQAGPVVVTL